jgi:hypothetical protein
MLSNCAFQSDQAENSIMQTITIAVSAILIAAGLVTAPGLINNARDNNATTDLANIAYAEEMFMGTTGQYSSSVTQAQADSSGFWLGKQDGLKYNLSSKVSNQKALVCSDPNWHYLAKATSSSGKTFFRVSGRSVTSTDISKIDVPSCISNLPGYADFISESSTPVTEPGSNPSTTPVVVAPTTPPVAATPLAFKTAPVLKASSIGVPVNYKLETNFPAADVDYSVSDDSVLPQGLVLSDNSIEGRISQAGQYEFTIDATSGTQTVSQDFDITINAIDLSNNAQPIYAAKSSYSTINNVYRSSSTGGITGVVVAPDGSVYHAQRNTVYKFSSPSDTKGSILAGSPGVSGSNDGPGSTATFSSIIDMVMDSAGNIYLTEGSASNGSVRKISPDGYVTTVVSLANVKALSIGPDGKLYVSTNGIGKTFVYQIQADGTPVVFAGTGAVTGDKVGPKLTATFSALAGMSWDSSGNLFIADGNYVKKIDTAGIVTNYSSTTGFDVYVDSKNNVFVMQNSKLVKIAPNLTVSTVVGNGTQGSASGLLDASLWNVRFFAVGSDGSIYIPDSGVYYTKVVK